MTTLKLFLPTVLESLNILSVALQDYITMSNAGERTGEEGHKSDN